MARMIFENNAWQLVDTWDIDDVRSVLDCESDFTDKDCVRVLKLVAQAFDANFGINWEAIGAAVDMVVKEKQGEKK